MEPAVNRVKTITTNAIVTVFSALMITMSGCAGIGTVTGPPPRVKMTTDIPESIIMPDTIKTRIGTLEFFDGFPANETVQKMHDHLYFHRAVDVFLDEMSTASILAVREGLRSVGVHECHQIAIFESLVDSKQDKLSEAKEPPQMTFISMAGKESNMLTNEGFAYFESLTCYINENPPCSQGMAMLGILENIGIAHGRPFEPDSGCGRS